jgi:hypothetical protein
MTIGQLNDCFSRLIQLWVRRRKVSQPNRVLATPEFKVDYGTPTELKANSLSAEFWRTSTRNFSNARQGFPSQRFLATPAVRIHPARSQSAELAASRESQLKMRPHLNRLGAIQTCFSVRIAVRREAPAAPASSRQRTIMQIDDV